MAKEYFLRDDSTETFSIGSFREFDNAASDNFFKVVIRLDDRMYNLRRSEYDWNMWFIAIGGFERSLKKLFAMLVTGITATSYNNAMLGNLFMMKSGRKDVDRDDDSSDAESANYRYASGNIKKNKKKSDQDALERTKTKAEKQGKIVPAPLKKQPTSLAIGTTDYKMRDTRYVSKKEEKHFNGLDSELKTTGAVSKESIATIISHIILNRAKYDAVIDPKTVCYSGLAKWCPCFYSKYKK